MTFWWVCVKLLALAIHFLLVMVHLSFASCYNLDPPCGISLPWIFDPICPYHMTSDLLTVINIYVSFPVIHIVGGKPLHTTQCGSIIHVTNSSGCLTFTSVFIKRIIFWSQEPLFSPDKRLPRVRTSLGADLLHISLVNVEACKHRRLTVQVNQLRTYLNKSGFQISLIITHIL